MQNTADYAHFSWTGELEHLMYPCQREQQKWFYRNLTTLMEVSLYYLLHKGYNSDSKLLIQNQEVKWSQRKKGWEEAFYGEGDKVFHQPHSSSTLSLCSCTCLVCPHTSTTVTFVQGPQTSWHTVLVLAGIELIFLPVAAVV